jgi:sensor histidine kinase YesM
MERIELATRADDSPSAHAVGIARSRAWRWAGDDVPAWTLVALLFTLQSADNSDRVECTLAEELAFLEKYLDIQEARFGARLRVSFEVHPETHDVQVPRLVLQPLVENAIRHGIARRSGPGTVAIMAACADGTLTLTVRDNDVGRPAHGIVREGVGLSSTRARLAQLYGATQSLVIAPAPEGGTICTIRIPCRADLTTSTNTRTNMHVNAGVNSEEVPAC